jgi:hypothetical protein
LHATEPIAISSEVGTGSREETRKISGRWDALSDEKIVSQLQATLTKTECPVSRRAFSSGVAFWSGACPARDAGWIPVRVKKTRQR